MNTTIRTLIGSLVFALALHAQVLETPIKSIPAKDHVDPKQQNKDFKTWRNMLKFYANIRMMALTSLEDLNAVADFAWASHKYLAAVERAAQRAQLVMDNVENFRVDNPVQMVKDAETKVFRNTDALFYNDIPSARLAQGQMRAKRENVMNRAGDRLQALADLSVRTYKGFEKKFFKVQLAGALDDRDAAAAAPDPDVQFYVHATNAAATNLATADIHGQVLETQGAILSGSLRNAAPGGAINLEHQAQMNYESQRNAVILNIQSNEYVHAAVKNTSWSLLVRAKKLDRLVAQKALVLEGAAAFSDELRRQRGTIK